MPITPKFRPALDADFVPAALWNREYRCSVEANAGAQDLGIALERRDGSRSVFPARILPHEGANAALNQRYVERLLKFLLWQRGGYRILIGGEPRIACWLGTIYTPGGARSFDHQFLGERVYGAGMIIESVRLEDMPEPRETGAALGRHLDGFRAGFDLGASDRKCAAVAEGEVVFSEEVPWNPVTQPDPQYHYEGISDSIRRAAAKLPRVDAIGGSAAGVYVNNEVRAGSLYRAVPAEQFERRIRRIFFDLQSEWGGVPFSVINDGEVAALAGSMALGENSVLGLAMGSSLAAGLVTSGGTLTTWLNELAFAPVDYRERAPVDEWSGDAGVGAQYFSQQAVSRLLRPAGIDLPEEVPLPEKLEQVQKLLAEGDRGARAIYETIGVYLGYSVAHFADFYEFRNLLLFGRVMSGEGGNIVLSTARNVLSGEFPELAERIRLQIPGEKEKRHGQAMAAASLPPLQGRG